MQPEMPNRSSNEDGRRNPNEETTNWFMTSVHDRQSHDQGGNVANHQGENASRRMWKF
jgi:hypothetical protein